MTISTIDKRERADRIKLAVRGYCNARTAKKPTRQRTERPSGKPEGQLDTERIANTVGISTPKATRHRSESSYRRGVSQGLSLAVDLIRNGGNIKDLCWLRDESLVMRYDGQSHPTYTDELMSRHKEING